MKQIIIPIKGMHCKSCELLIENEMSQIPGVTKVEVSEKRACAIVRSENMINESDIKTAAKKAGYEVGSNEKKPWFSKKPGDYLDIFYALFALAILYLIVDVLGLTKLFAANVSKPTNLIAILFIGLTAGFSTCMALIGGLVLGTSARFSLTNPEASGLEKFKPHIFFNAGRISSYIILGGAIGALGSIFQLSGFSLGLMTLAVALVMLTIGIQLTGLFPRLENFKLTLPSGVAKMIGIKNRQNQEYSHKNAFLLGATTFFLPCGFTQAMQLYAISTGNFLNGAAIMGMFAIGTTPGLLGIGGITSLIKGAYAQKFFKFAGVVVIVLSLFNFNNGLNLIGWDINTLINQGNNVLAATTNNNNVTQEGNLQIVRMKQTGSGYEPNSFTIKSGVPVKWIITADDPGSCSASILASKIGIRTVLQPGENTFEFTPTEAGKISFSCMMGMYRGSFTVVEGNGNSNAGAEVKGTTDTAVAANTQSGSSGTGGGGCGCGGGAKKQVDQNATPAPAVVENSVQVIKTTYTAANDINPNSFSVKKGKPVSFVIDVKDEGSGCMSSVMISRLTQPQFLEKGKTLKFEFTPETSGDYPITCAMGVPRGNLKVI